MEMTDNGSRAQSRSVVLVSELLGNVAHALVRGASRLLSTPVRGQESRYRDESRYGTHKCVRHHCQRV